MPAPLRIARARPRPRVAAAAAAALALALAASSCHLPPLSLFFGGESRLEVTISKRLNNNAPVAVEVVIAYDKALYEQLLKTDAKTWFAQRDQFVRDHANGRRLFDSWYREWVPGQAVAAIPLEYRIGARGGLIFISYATSGDHRQTFDPERDLRLDLREQDFTVAQG
jgi:type VI secretion system protein